MELGQTKDLIVLTADPQMRGTVAVLLAERRPSLGLPDLTFDVRAHPNRDPGCRTASASALNPLRRDYQKAIVILDLHGSGAGNLAASELEVQVEQQLVTSGWSPDDVAAVVIEPELEAWLFGVSWSHMQAAVRWSQSEPIREWLESREFLQPGGVKPPDPKAAFQALLDLQRVRRSGRLLADLARQVSLNHCHDPAFHKFRSTLHRWFPTG